MSWLRGGSSLGDAAAARLAPLSTNALMLEAARVLESHGLQVEDAIADALRGRVATDRRPTPSALDLLRRWLNAIDDVERERVEAETRRLLTAHAAGLL